MKAAPHSAASRKVPLKTVYSGAMFGTRPSSVCASAMSFMPLVKMRASVELVADRRAVEMILFQPAELLAVRAIGEHRNHVRPLRPADEVADAVEQRDSTHAKRPTGAAEEWTMTDSSDTTFGASGESGASRRFRAPSFSVVARIGAAPAPKSSART